MDLDLNEFAKCLMDEEWKPFPKDKVNRQIEKKKKSDSYENRDSAKTMRAVSNFKTRDTDTSKASQKLVGKDSKKYWNKVDKHHSDAEKTASKGADHMIKGMVRAAVKTGQITKKDAKKKKPLAKVKDFGKLDDYSDKKVEKHRRKDEKLGRKAQDSTIKGNAMVAVKRAYQKSTHSDDKKQVEHNKKDKEARATAKRMMNRAGLEAAHKKPAVKGGTKGGFKEHLNFSEFLAAIDGVEPMYQVEGEMPKCPRGHRWDMESKRCVPKRERDSVSPDGKKDAKPENGPGYNTWGKTGINGDGYAWAEPNGWGDSGGGGDMGSGGHV